MVVNESSNVNKMLIYSDNFPKPFTLYAHCLIMSNQSAQA